LVDVDIAVHTATDNSVKNGISSWVQWLMPKIVVTQEAEIGRIMV
jgi:uncharacterized protein (DUF305 family)